MAQNSVVSFTTLANLEAEVFKMGADFIATHPGGPLLPY